MNTSSGTFLDKVAARILLEHQNSMQHACVVFPNRRAGVFLKQHLSERLHTPALAPAVFAIEDFVFEHVDLNHTDQLILLWELYQCYTSTAPQDVRPFEEFLKWGKVLLQDFEETDMYLLDAQVLFGYLSEARAVELWNPGKPALTAGQQSYLLFYRSLSSLYQAFTQRLIAQRMAYKGLAFRKLSESDRIVFSGLPWDHYYFAGFNALTPSEKRIIDLISENKKITHLYDADSYYLNDSKQESGKYLREVRKQSRSGKFEWVGEDLTLGKKKIEVIGSPHNTGQALIAGSILAGIDNTETGKTAVILNDESLLIPLLNVIPDSIGSFNVTMGFPFSLTPMYGLADTIFRLHLHAFERSLKQNDGSAGESQIRFYYRDVSGLLRHPYIIKFLACHQKDNDTVQALLSQGRVFFSKEDIFNAFESDSVARTLLELIFCDWHDVVQAVDKLSEINVLLATVFQKFQIKEELSPDIDYLYTFSVIMNRLKLLAGRAGLKMSLRGIQQLIRSVAASTHIPFSGEPLKGVQIMGMLESRTLDFKNIIMLGVNEGVLPAAQGVHSFIPYDIRREFGLMVHNDRDAVFAYHFYRLLQRCENMYLIYNTTSDDTGGGEKSRYILQIKHELTGLNPNIMLSERFYSPPVKFDVAVNEIYVEKSPDIMAELEKLAGNGFSPTALSTFIVCSLKFYFTYIIRLDEDNLVPESMDASTFGTGIHEALHELYRPFSGFELTSEILDHISSEANSKLHDNFLKAYNNNDIDYGRNLLMVKVGESYLRRFIRIEKEFVGYLQTLGKQLILESTEYDFGKENPIGIHIHYKSDEHFPVRLRGKADRIDRIGTQIRVIDFKTGFVKAKDLVIKDWDEMLNDPEKSKALQLTVYAFLYAKQFSESLPDTGIISFRNLKSGFLPVVLPGEPKKFLAGIEQLLRQLIQSLFNNNAPFNQTTRYESCEYCSYRGICSR